MNDFDDKEFDKEMDELEKDWEEIEKDYKELQKDIASFEDYLNKLDQDSTPNQENK